MHVTDLDTRKSLIVCCSHCLVPHSDCNENGVPTKYNFRHVHAGDPKLQSVVSAAISLKYDSAVWGLRTKRVGVLENK